MNGSSRTQFAIAFVLFCLTTTFSFPIHAAPDAGQTSRELQQQPDFVPPEDSAPVIIEKDDSPTTNADDIVRFMVSAIRVTGSRVFAAKELEALVVDLAGAEHSLSELEAGAARITAHYRNQGYMVARAYLPAQDIKEGVVIINVLEGQVGEVKINNQSRLTNQTAKQYLDGIQRGDVLQSKFANRALLLLGDTPGVGRAQASMQPGVAVGSTNMIVDLAASAPIAANITADNHGNYYTGERRVNVDVSLISLFKKGDLISLSALTTDQQLTYGRAAFQTAIGGNGLRVGAAHSASRYRLGKDLTVLQAHGSALGTSLYGVYPFIRSISQNLNGIAMYERKKLVDSLTSSVKRVKLTSLGLSGSRRDNLGGSGFSAFELTIALGRLSMDDASRTIDLATAKSNGRFTKLRYNIKRIQQLPMANSLSVKLSGQRAGKNLDSAEKLYLGGANSIRAYPQAEESGDEGHLVNLELRHRFSSMLQAMVFYDAGSVKIKRNNYAAGNNTRYLAGAGVGLDAMLYGLHVKTSVAWRTSSSDPVSEPSSRIPRLWLLVGKQF
ncbi:MAG: ShlB/FhaC/HecB family hemolysin secretion/activation protein [Gallionella sp.]